MALRNIVMDPNEKLRKTCREVKEVTPHILALLDDLKETMVVADGVGLAAPQVGVLRRVVVVDVGDEHGVYELINPSVIYKEGENRDQEGCLSCEGRRGYVTRPEFVRVKAMNRDGEWVEYEGKGLLARAFCHEIDHLDGILFTDIMDEEIFDNEEDDDLETDEEFENGEVE